MKTKAEMLNAELEKMSALIKKSTDVKLAAAMERQLDSIRRHTTGRKEPKKTASNSGLLKPVPITAEMAAFAGWDKDGLYSRTNVTSVICKYVKDNNLQNPENKREVLLDTTLSKLLRCEEKAILYPHIQKYISVHFLKVPKPEKPVEAEPEAEPEVEAEVEAEPEPEPVVVKPKKKVVRKSYVS